MKITKIEPTVPVLPKRKRVAAYARVSVERDRTVHSLSAQVSYYSELIQKNPEWEYAGVYADLGETGTSEKRAEWNRMLADCDSGKIDIVLTKSISRFARNTVILLETVRHLKSLGIEVRFEKENISSMSGDGELMLSILASFAQEESYSASENNKWAARKRFQQGKQNPAQIYGYQWDGESFTVIREKAEVVRFIYDSYLSGTSPRVIAETLNEQGVKSLLGTNFCEKIIRSILSNEKYIGTVIMQKTFVENHITKKKRRNNGELPRYVIENAHEPIIDREIFDKVQERLQSRKINVERTAFTGKILCEACGCNFMRSTKHHNGVTKKVYQCNNKKNCWSHKCDTIEILETLLYDISAEVLGLTAFDADIFNEQIKGIVVTGKHTLIFHLHNGKSVQRDWSFNGRKSSWTPERRAQQAERMREKQRIKRELKQEAAREKDNDHSGND
jgi:DNA invertase Pin-like site-specific DNA recombinase